MPVVNYDWDDLEDNIVEEYDEAGTTIAEYTTEPGLHGNVISQRRDGQESNYHSDGQGSTLALTNAAGDITDTHSYNAFGELTARTGDTVNPFQFIGQKGYYLDTETGEYDVRQRPLLPVMGRWLSEDPIRLELNTTNLYSVTNNRPTMFTDPTGLYPNYECSIFTFFMRPDGFVCGLVIGYRGSDTLLWNIYEKCVGTICDPFLGFSDAANIGLSVADKQFGVAKRGDPRHQALRHCVASGVLAIATNCACARCAGVHRELFQNECHGQKMRDAERGEFNNGQGRLCAGCSSTRNRTGGIGETSKTTEEVIECCKKKLSDGLLDDAPPNSPGHAIKEPW